MDPLEWSPEDKLSVSDCNSLLYEAMVAHDEYPPWWYHLNYISGSENNFSSYLGLDEEHYHALMVKIGFVKVVESQHRRIFMKQKIEDFLIGYDIELKNLTVFKVSRVASKKLLWIKLGDSTGTRVDWISTASTQFKDLDEQGILQSSSW